MRLIKISNTHYVIVDNSEIKEVPCCNIAHRVIVIPTDLEWANTNRDNLKVITHSTQPLEEDIKFVFTTPKISLGFVNIKSLSLSEVEEAIYGYNVEEMANTLIQKKYPYPNYNYLEYWKDLYKEGFNAHKELVKNKLFTTSFILDLVPKVLEKQSQLNSSDFNDWYNSDFLKMLFPKIEWDVEFDENGKLKLI